MSSEKLEIASKTPQKKTSGVIIKIDLADAEKPSKKRRKTREFLNDLDSKIFETQEIYA